MGAGLRSEGTPLVEVTRGKWTENVHNGHVAIADADGRLLAWAGDPGAITFMRSTAKPIQAIPVLMGGVTKEYGLNDEAVAMMAASHCGGPEHVTKLERMLAQIGVTEDGLALPKVYPADQEERDALLRKGAAPRKLYHGCAGKHIGALALCKRQGWPLEHYTQPDHPAQREMLRRVAEFSGIGEGAVGRATDGCGFPVFALPLWRLALAYARLAAPPSGWADAALRAAAERAAAAMNRHPALVEGPGRLASLLLGDDNILAKSGAQGVFAFALRRQRLGVAVKVTDGAEAALPIAVAAILESLAASAHSGPPRQRGLQDIAAAVRERFPAEVRTDAGDAVGRFESVVRLSYGERYPRSKFM
ncbi:asparaginase [Paenibacillus abyssi]|uniref:Asparaginase n=1 Tax=Paenibacillus abyssi TaxID=1340531 RepID=A0A917FQX5_9BACL|nr:asparaginase [Paenibacillus abyssi]GGF95662.1 asparaginase [Paenibacillus abyssi]